MGPLVGATELSKALIKPHSSTDAILSVLDEIEYSLLSNVEQNPTASVQSALHTLMKTLVSADLLRNPDSDVRVFVVSCLTKIMSIIAPEAPYNDHQTKEIFQVTVEAFGKLSDASCRSYKKAEAMLETVAKVRSSLVMLDLEYDELVLEMFRQFLNSIRLFHPQLVLTSMETVMCTIIDESEDISLDLLEILLTAVNKDNRDVSPMASTLVEKVLRSCAFKLRPCIMEALHSKGTSLELYSPVFSSICQSEYAITQALNIVNAKGNEDKLNLGNSCKGNMSKRTARVGIHFTNRVDKAGIESGSKRKRKPNSLMNPEEGYQFKIVKNSRKKAGDDKAGIESGSKRKRKPNSLMNPEEGYQFKIVKNSRKKAGDDKAGIESGSKRKRKPNSLMNPEEGYQFKIVKNSRKKAGDDKAGIESGSKRKRKPNSLMNPEEGYQFKIVKTSGKKAAHSNSKKKKSEDASMDTPIPRLSKSKKKNSSAASHQKKKRRAGEEVESTSDEPGEELVGKRVNVWWPLHEKLCEGVIDSFSITKKTHRVLYLDGLVEELDLRKERFNIIQDNSSASQDKEIDLPQSIPLSVLIQRLKVKKSKKVSMNVEPSSSPKVSGTKKQTKRKSSKKKRVKRVTRRKSLAEEVQEYGFRRSRRIKSRPLKFWRGEKFMFRRIQESLAVIGIKYVSEDYKEMIDLTALH